MNNAVTVTLSSDCEIQMTRVFNAKRELVFRCYTEPELIQRWMLGPPGWEFVTCDVDLWVGGKYHFVWKDLGNQRMGIHGTYTNIVKPSKLADIQSYDGDSLANQTVGDVSFSEQGKQTTVTTLLRYRSTQVRDAALQSGMAQGMEWSFKSLENLINNLSISKNKE